MAKNFRMDWRRWSAIGMIAATYVYFLLFAQFGFLHHVRESLGQEYWNQVLASMGLAGLLGAFLTLRCYRSGAGRVWLMTSFAGAGVAALLAASATRLFVFMFAAGMSGFFLSILTVSLVGFLADSMPTHRVALVCGMGTGVAYFLSNLPFIFEASAGAQCLVSALVCLGGFLCAMHADAVDHGDGKPHPPYTGGRVLLIAWICVFMALVWADSAAFTRIQETPRLKAASWTGAGPLLSIGMVHWIAAILAGLLMHAGRWRLLLGASFSGLLLGWLGLEYGVGGLSAAWIYAAAVSFYSTGLVGFALLHGGGFNPIVLAGTVYGISGWVGSAMGIGMVNDLGTVPLVFWALAAVFLAAGLYLVGRKATV